MEKELIIPRKKSTSVKCSIGMLFATIIMVLPMLLFFYDFSWTTSEVPLWAAILCMVCAPLCFFCSIYYFKQLFNSDPILVVNSIGIHERMSGNSVGLIKWEHIENINIIPQAEKVYFICIVLKQPEIYIDNVKLLAKLNKQKGTKKWGHIRFSSLYFKKEFPEVINTIKYYYNINRQSVQS